PGGRRAAAAAQVPAAVEPGGALDVADRQLVGRVGVPPVRRVGDQLVVRVEGAGDRPGRDAPVDLFGPGAVLAGDEVVGAAAVERDVGELRRPVRRGALGAGRGGPRPRADLRHDVAVAVAVVGVAVAADHVRTARRTVRGRAEVVDAAHVEHAKAAGGVGDEQVVAVPEDPARVERGAVAAVGRVLRHADGVVVAVGPRIHQQDVPVGAGVGVHEADADALDHAVGTVVVVVPADQDGLVAVAPFLVSLHVGDRGDALGIPLGGGVVAVVEAGAADDRHRASGLHGVRLAGAVDGDRSGVVPPVQVGHAGG